MKPIVGFFLFAALCTSLPVAHTATGQFAVHIELNPANEAGVCVSAHESDRANAVVRVVCRDGTFVSIEPRQGAATPVRHGLAARYHLSRQHLAYARGSREDVGSETAFRVLDWAATDGRLELVVQF
jgi:hypothetical protein